jgi:hypothetical protein
VISWSRYGKLEINATSRIEHVKSHLDGGFNLAGYIANIKTGQGDPVACLDRLSSHAYAQAIEEWFGNSSLEKMKAWFFIADSLRQYRYSLKTDKMNFMLKTFDFLASLVSDNESLISWFCNNDDIVDTKRIQATTTADFVAYQIRLAVKGDFTQLRDRCARMIAHPPSGPKKRFMLDNEFFIALAEGDKSKMESVLRELTTPASIKRRFDSENGYSEGLISTFGVIYAKIAWRHGYEVVVDTPYIPSEWLPVKPLAHYDAHYEFLKREV